ncbi:hypothetical protein HALLA_08180 [Halostagnicola larsenii XH-48]|uniref:Uncharacterized protein n=1 Tax=Halostagnicola larsenii XH-48 TaxID=797299 RepID=W0JJS5_9EURY|nr:DUF5791 family protein [Halostagnicola larsenii]AHF98843.1 hypothetical protein HALLA_08180 [Halostagnicola larsenii XH-48]
MFYEQRMSVPESPAELRAEYDDDLAQVLETRGLEHVSMLTGIDEDRLESIGTAEPPSLSLEEAAQIQSQGSDDPDPETIETMACEHLLLGMSTAVLDVDAVESELEIDLDPKEIQQKIERRAPMSFDEYVHVQHTIVSNTP